MITRTLVAAACAAITLPAASQLLLHEPFDYGGSYINGQGGALGTTGTWATTDTGEAQGWYSYAQGTLSGHTTDGVNLPNVFDGTYGNLPSSGGYAGSAGPAERSTPNANTDSGTGNLDANIAIDPSVTATFQSNTTTWMSWVSARSWDRNEGAPQVMLTNLASSGGTRGQYLGGAGNRTGEGIGGGGGPSRANLLDIYPQYFEGGVNNHAPGGYDYPEEPWTGDENTQGNWNGSNFNLGTLGTNDGKQMFFGSGNDGTSRGTLLDNHQVPGTITQAEVQVYDQAEFTPGGDFGDYNVVVMKIEWDADTGGEDIISLVAFTSSDAISEAAFDAAIAAQPQMSSANWVGKNEMVTSAVDGLQYQVTYDDNKPDLDQSTFNLINIQSLKFYVDEIRIAQDFSSAIGGGSFDPADLDQDGDVDDADFGIAFAAFTGPGGGPSSNPAADLDGDGDVDDADFGIAFAAFTGPGGGPANVPEPASLALLGLGGLLIARRRRA